MPAVNTSNNIKDINLNTTNCDSPTSVAIELPINFRDSNCIASKSEQNAIFEVSDIEASTVCTTDSDNTVDSASTYGETEGTNMSLDPSESDQEIESHLIHKEEQDVTYMIPVPKTGTSRDSSLTPITIMGVDTMGLNRIQGTVVYI